MSVPFETFDVTPFFEHPRNGNVVDKPAQCRKGDLVARTHYFLRSFGVEHWTLSPDGVLWFRDYLAQHAEKAREAGKVPLFRPPVIASWKANSMVSDVYAGYPEWEEYGLARRFSLDLDPLKEWGGEFPERGEWAELAELCWAVVCRFITNADKSMGKVYVFGGKQHEGADKPFSAHLIFADWCTPPTANKFHADLEDALAVFWAVRGVEFDGSIYGSGLKYPFMDKEIRGRGYRGYTNALTYTNLGRVPSYKELYSDCDPLVLTGCDGARELEFVALTRPTAQEPPTRRIRMDGQPPARGNMDAHDEEIARRMIEYYQSMYDAGAVPQGGYPIKVGANIKILWKDSSHHECQHRGNNHKSIYFAAKDSMLITCMGNDTPLKVWVSFRDFMPFDAEEDLEVADDVVDGAVEDFDFFDWLYDTVITHGKALSPSVPIFRREFEASDSIQVTPPWALERNDEIMSQEVWTNIAQSSLSPSQKTRLRTELTNLKYTIVMKTAKILHRVAPGVYDYSREQEVRLAMSPFKVPGSNDKPIMWFNVWKGQFGRSLHHDSTIQPCVSIDPFPVHPDKRAICWMIPRFVGKTSRDFAYLPENAQKLDKVMQWWSLMLRRMVGNTRPGPSYPQDVVAFRNEAVSFLERWVCAVLFGGRNTQVAVYICERFGGAGKTMLGEIMSAVLGEMGSTPDTFRAFVADKWKTNYVGKSLIIIDDSAHNPRDRDAASVWKSWITKSMCEVEHKFGGKHTMPWYGNFLTLSNSAFAIPGITADERRVFALRADPNVTSDAFTRFEFNEFGQKTIKTNKDRYLEILTGFLYHRWIDLGKTPPTHADVQRLRSTIIADNQTLHEDALLQWLEQRWEEYGYFVTPAQHEQLIVPNSWGAKWSEPMMRGRYTLSSLFAQFKIDTNSSMGFKFFCGRIRQAYPDFVRKVDPQMKVDVYYTVLHPRGSSFQRQADGGWSLLTNKARPSSLQLVLPRQGFPQEVGRHGQLVAACRDAGSLRSPEGNE